MGARNLAYAAMEIATVEQLLPGRIDVGIGFGMPSWIRSVGVWTSSPLTLLKEYSRVSRELLAGV
jgi:5,10-methylenetetrahydromethanopterin reductase